MLKFLQAATIRIFSTSSIFFHGWQKRWIEPVSFMVVAAVGLSAGIPVRGTAQESDPDSETQQVRQTPPVSFQELLEFVGQWQTDDGGWVDPTDLDWLPLADQETGNDEEK